MPRARPRRHHARGRRLAFERGDAKTRAQDRVRHGRAGGRPAGADRQRYFHCASRSAVPAGDGNRIADGGLKLGRRAFIRALSGAFFTTASSVRGQTDTVHVTIDYENAGRPIAPDFIGLSYESAILSPGTYFAPENAALIALIRALGAGVLRIGGNTSERTMWEPAGAAAAGSILIKPAPVARP